jgi:DNA replication protein DnaC
MINSKDLALKVKEMRKAQTTFFRSKQYKDLDKARKLEQEVDKMVSEVLSYGQPSTGNLFLQK